MVILVVVTFNIKGVSNLVKRVKFISLDVHSESAAFINDNRVMRQCVKRAFT